jgi:hypothetical protein
MKPIPVFPASLTLGGLLCAGLSALGQTAVRNVPFATASPNAAPLYASNRSPLAPSPFMKLPIGGVRPEGWLRVQLQLEADGMIGHLEEISHWCKFEGNAWAAPDGLGENGWEELPYWLKGYGDLGYVLQDEKITKEARRWIDAVIASQEPDGWFGPRSLKTSLGGQPDLWPHMIMLNVLQSFQEYTGDPRVVPMITGYMKWLNAKPGKIFGNGYWPRIRAGDLLETAYWLYNRTGDSFLLDLGKKIHENMQDWTSGVHDWHNVNLSQGFREPGVYFQQSRDPKFLAAANDNYQTVMGLYGQFSGGGFSGDENCRPGHGDPHQGFETCGIVEFMHSFEMLTKISGDPRWSDRCEELAFNSLPAALTPDEKGLHYLTCANAAQLDPKNHSPGIQNSGTMLSYSPGEVYRCCQHNVSHGWPYFAEELWLATADQGLCASLFAPSSVSAKVGGGATVRIVEETEYPFNDTLVFHISPSAPARFPLYFRVPAWCEKPSAKVNSKAVALKGSPVSYAIIEREWREGDTVTLRLPMRPRVKTWARNHHAVSVDYGPLAFSLKIGEKWRRYGGSDAWPDYEVSAETPWNYGLVLAGAKLTKNLEIVKKPGPLAGNPFTLEFTPVEIRAKAKKIPAWTFDRDGLVAALQDSPIQSDEAVQTVALVPMGAARLRVTSFPVIGAGRESRAWSAAKTPPVSASYCNDGDSVEAMIDGMEPKGSNDQTIPRFTWWDHRGGTEWVQWDFLRVRRVSAAKVYWFDDAPNGGCRTPERWKVLYKDGPDWKEVQHQSPAGVDANTYNRVSFDPVLASAIRLEVRLKPGFSGGILEWKLEE